MVKKLSINEHEEEFDFTEGKLEEISAPALSADDLTLIVDMRRRGATVQMIADILGYTAKHMQGLLSKIDEWEKSKPFKDLNLDEYQINEVELEVPKNKETGAIVAIGDVHYDGNEKHYNAEKFKGFLEYSARSNSKLILMGDLIDCNLRNSPGAGIFSQSKSPAQQTSYMVNLLYPYRKNIIGLHFSNHEMRVHKETSFNPVEMMARALEVPVLGYTAYTKVHANKQVYWLYTFHGSANGSTLAGKFNALRKATSFIRAPIDIFAMGHTHSLGLECDTVQNLSDDGKNIEERKVYYVLTGHYMHYRGSYAEMKSMAPGRIGSPKFIFYKDKHHVHVAV